MSGEDVPNFYASLKNGEVVPEEITYEIRNWFKGKGLYLTTMFVDALDPDEVMQSISHANPGLHYILSGKGVKGADHSVVCCDGKMVHDPSRLGYGLSGPTSSTYFYVHFIGMAV
jgi:hypothetical protein